MNEEIPSLTVHPLFSTNNQTRNYLRSNYLPSASDAQVDQVLQLYPEDPIVGSPFDTGIANAVTPQYKRLAAFQGDLVFQAPRRFFLEQRSGKQNAWSFREHPFHTVF